MSCFAVTLWSSGASGLPYFKRYRNQLCRISIEVCTFSSEGAFLFLFVGKNVVAFDPYVWILIFFIIFCVSIPFLRCLRTVCDSWHLFVEFSVTRELINQSSKKKRKLYSDDSNFQAEGSSTSLKSNKVKRLIEKECGGKHYQTTGNPYKEAKECLLSLKNSVESLHQKNLFPYNPKVLLKRWVCL